MITDEPYPNASGCAARAFRTTHWSVILAVGQEGAEQSAALEKLCQAYWFPLYAFVRRQGHSKA